MPTETSADDLPAVADGHDDPARGPQGARVVLDHDAASAAAAMWPRNGLPICRGVGVRVADAVGAHDDDEVGARLQPDVPRRTAAASLSGRRRTASLTTGGVLATVSATAVARAVASAVPARCACA